MREYVLVQFREYELVQFREYITVLTLHTHIHSVSLLRDQQTLWDIKQNCPSPLSVCTMCVCVCVCVRVCLCVFASFT